MKKDSIVSLLIILLLVSGMSMIKVRAAEVPLSMQITYQEIAALRGLWGVVPVTGYDIDVWNDYNVLVLDLPGTYPTNLSTLKEPDGSPNHYNSDAGEYRYIGYNPDGYLVNNPKYPDDHSGSALINTYNWQKNTDPVTDIRQYISSPQDQAFYEKEIFYFLEKEYGPRFDPTEDPSSWLLNAIVIVPVSSTGDGVIKYMHKWDSDGDGVDENWYITVNLRSKNEVKDSVSILDSIKPIQEPISSQTMAQLGPSKVGSNQVNQEIYDVSQGIPATEDLYVNIRAGQYLSNESYNHISGSLTYSVTVNQPYVRWRWNDTKYSKDLNGDGDRLDPGEVWGGWDSRRDVVSKTYDVSRPYSYYLLKAFEVYELDTATVSSQVFFDPEIKMTSSVIAPRVSAQVDTAIDHHLILPSTEKNIEVNLSKKNLGKTEDNKSYPSLPNPNLNTYAENAVDDIQVRNDGLSLGGTSILSNAWYDAKAPSPKSVPTAAMNGPKDLYISDISIPRETLNGRYRVEGQLSYKKVYDLAATGDPTKTLAITGLNKVVLHTPVVCYPKIQELPWQTQLSDYDPSVFQGVIEESFHVDYPTKGQHDKIPGYGDRDYSKYTQVKQVKFPFDVYVGTGYQGQFLPKETWGNFTSDEQNFFLPSWVKESSGYLLFRTIPINMDTAHENQYEFNANLDISKYKAVEALAYNIGGKIFDFAVEDCPDDFWKDSFTDGPMYVGGSAKGYEESVALDPHDDGVDSNEWLPLLPGKTASVDGELRSQKGVMLGYPIHYTIKTNGDLTNSKDFIRLVPRYYYVAESGGRPDMTTRQEVDVYYSSYSSLEAFDKAFILRGEDRSYIGNLSEKHDSIPATKKEESVQEWKGTFYLPNKTYVVAKGTDIKAYTKLNLDDEPFLKDGYIIVNLQILLYKDVAGVTSEMLYDEKQLEAYLKTIRPYQTYGKAWQGESYETSQLGLDLQEGDTIFYSTNRRAAQTYY